MRGCKSVRVERIRNITATGTYKISERKIKARIILRRNGRLGGGVRGGGVAAGVRGSRARNDIGKNLFLKIWGRKRALKHHAGGLKVETPINTAYNNSVVFLTWETF